MHDHPSQEENVIIIGGGPAGLTAAYQLSKAGIQSTVLEKDKMVGGLAKTVNYKGFRFDIGGHRFFTKVKSVEKIWHDVLTKADFLHCRRLSRIYYNRTFFRYPLKPLDTLLGLGIGNSVLIFISYLLAQCFPQVPEHNFERWVSNRFGKRLYKIFFKTYTEKVWGIPPHQISADWAEQRIKDLSLPTAIKNALFKHGSQKGQVIKTLIDEFHYPKHGPGMMWETVAEFAERNGSQIRLGASVERILWSKKRVLAIEIQTNGQREVVRGTQFISSMPLRELIHKFAPPLAQPFLQAAKQLHYRDFLIVALIVRKRDVFPDNWIYIHNPEVKVGRIQNFKNWSAHMVPNSSQTCLGLEYFCFKGDGLWSASDQDLIELGKKELELMGLATRADIEDGTVVRIPMAYPVYDHTYREALACIRQFLDGLENFQSVGRNGMHKYNNQDHSMLTAMLAVENIAGANHDLWRVNADQAYHEEMTSREATAVDDLAALAATQPRVPEEAAPSLALTRAAL